MKLYVCMLGAICRFAQSVDRAAHLVDLWNAQQSMDCCANGRSVDCAALFVDTQDLSVVAHSVDLHLDLTELGRSVAMFWLGGSDTDKTICTMQVVRIGLTGVKEKRNFIQIMLLFGTIGAQPTAGSFSSLSFCVNANTLCMIPQLATTDRSYIYIYIYIGKEHVPYKNAQGREPSSIVVQYLGLRFRALALWPFREPRSLVRSYES